MKFWFHVIAAFVGLGTAAGIVVLVFSQADQQGSSQSGQAPSDVTHSASGTRSDNTSCKPGDDAPGVVSATGVSKAKTAMPSIFDQLQREVIVDDAKQRLWFQRLQAALGLCGDEVQMYKTRVSASATYPSSVSDADLGAYAYGYFQQAFAEPLFRPTAELDIVRGDDEPRHILVTRSVWQLFIKSHGAYKLPANFAGLRAYKRKLGLEDSELQFTGW